MSRNEFKIGRQAGRGSVEARQRRRFLPSLLGLEDRKLLSTFTVTNTLDNTNPGSLRWAIGQANTAGGNNTINFDPTEFATPQTIDLTGGVLNLTDTSGTTTVVAPAAPVTIDGGGSSQILNVAGSVNASISGLTLTNASSSSQGGAVYNNGTLYLNGCTISGNSTSSTGGGLFNGGSGDLTMTDCTVSGNTESGDYGGGGIYSDGSITMLDSTISGNYAGDNGGALYLNYGTVSLTNCTISGNSAVGLGGGIQIFAGSVVLSMQNCTMANNTAEYGGGLFNFYGSATLNDTIVSGNTATVSSNYDSIFNDGGSVSGSYNLIGIGSVGGLTNGTNGNLVGVANAALGTLGNYGGPTETIPLLPGSPAIDAGTSDGAPSTDQRGLSRYGNVDIGSFESQGFTFSVVPGGTPQTATIGTSFANPLAIELTANNPIEPVDGGVVYFVANPASNGASAGFSSSTATITNGLAAITAAPNDVDGTYTVTASFATFSTSFDLTNTGPPLAPLVVNTTSDSLDPGPGLLSLREAINDDNTTAFPNPVLPILFDPTVFSTNQTITLTGGVLELSTTTAPLTITGPAAGVTIDAGGASQVFQIDPGVTASLSGLTITGGQDTTYGGGVFDEGNLTLTDCLITGNNAGFGAGLDVSASGTATLNGCLISNNYASYLYYGYQYGDGGGVLSAGTLTLTDCIVTGNTAGNTCGGVEVLGPTTMTGCTIDDNTGEYGGGFVDLRSVATLTDCTISDNTATVFGAGVATDQAGCIATLTDCTISGNAAGQEGGGVYNGFSSTLNLIDSTVSGNTAGTSGGGLFLNGTVNITGSTTSGNSAYSNGGGIFVDEAVLNMTNSTISGNTATNGGGIDFYYSLSSNLVNCTISGNTATNGSGGGLYDSNTTLSLTNSIVALNYGIYGAGDIGLATTSYYLPLGTISGSYNLVGTGGSGGLVNGVDGNLVDVADPLLSPLGNYGGPTETIALLPGSPAIGAGTSVSGVTTDQRGITIGDTPDIGSFYSEGFTYTVVPGSTPQIAGTNAPFDQPLAVTVTAVDPLDPVAGGVVSFSVTTATNGATAVLTDSTATIGSDGVAGVIATANGILGTYTASASIPGSTGTLPANFVLTNVAPLVFTGITSQTVTEGTNVIFSGEVSNGQASPVGETIAITLDGVTQYAVISSTGAFSSTFSTTDVPASVNPYTVTYVYTSDEVTFGGASTTSQLTVTPVITFGPIGNQVYGVAPLTLAGTASSGLPITYVVISGPASVDGDILTITGAGIVDIEADAGNSTTGFAPPVDESFTVTPATLTIHGTAGQSKAYGAAVPHLTETVTGFVDGDTSSLLTGAAGTVATTTSAVGTYAFTVGTLSAGANYVFVVAPSPTFAVVPATLTVNPTAGQSKVYGAAVPSLTDTISGFVNGDTSLLITGSLATTATTTSGVGSYAFTVGTLTAGPNYTLTVAASPTFTVTPATLTVDPTTGQSKVYGAAVPSLTGTVTGYVNGDSSSLLSGAPGTTATASSGVGTYAFTAGTLSAGPNYTFSVAASPTFAVTPAMLQVLPTAGQSKTYGATVPTLTDTVTGFVNGDTSSILTGSPGTVATTSSGVGTYAFTAGTLSAGANYTLNVAASPSFTVTPAVLIIDPTAGQSKLYGSPIPTLTFTAIGLQNGDPQSIVTGSLGTTASASSPIPAYYSFTLGTLNAGPNYTLLLAGNAPSFVVNRVNLTVTPTAGQSKVYGAADPYVTYAVAGFVNGDNSSILTGNLLPTSTATSPVGDYPITLGTLFAGPDYNLVLAPSSPTFAVTPATLIVEPTAGQSKVFGAPVPALTDTLTGLVNGDGDTPTIVTGSISTTATATSPTGTYPFTLGTLNAGPNYNLVLDPSSPTFSVTTTATDLPPVVVNQEYSTLQGTPLTTTASNGVLAGATDPNGLPLTALLLTSPSQGTLNLSPDGSFTYTPGVGYSGIVSFTYQAYDGNSDSPVATVTLDVKAPVQGDYFGTSQTDPAIYLANIGAYAIQNPETGANVIVPFGVAGAGQTIPAPGDYFGNGLTDLAVYIPSQGVYVIRNPSGGPDVSVAFGSVGAGQTIPAPGDYFGTGIDDLAVYLPSIGAFAIRNPAGGPDEIVPFGMAGAGNSIPVPGDYDGSGKTELAVYMPSLGEFAYRPANGGPDVVEQFGIAGTGNSIPVPGDYDGSGKTEFAVYLPSLGEFAYRPANGGPDVVESFGIAGAGQTLPAPGDYLGVGHDQLAAFLPNTATFVFRPGNGQPDISGSFGAAGQGETFPITVVDQALAEMTSTTVTAQSIEIPDTSTTTDTVIFPSTTVIVKKKKHATQ